MGEDGELGSWRELKQVMKGAGLNDAGLKEIQDQLESLPYDGNRGDVIGIKERKLSVCVMPIRSPPFTSRAEQLNVTVPAVWLIQGLSYRLLEAHEEQVTHDSHLYHVRRDRQDQVACYSSCT